MKRTYEAWAERAIGGFKYLIAGYLMLSGAFTAFGPGDPSVSAMHGLYTNHISLFILGSLIFLSGFTLLVGKLMKSRKWTGRGLFAVYLCYLFATILNFIAYSGDPALWLGNAIGFIVVGALWLRWKFKTEYVNPRHFRDDVNETRYEGE